jgi:hypothetical protein
VLCRGVADGEEEGEEEMDVGEEEFDDYDACVSVCVGGGVWQFCLALLRPNWNTSSSSPFHACRSSSMATRGMMMMAMGAAMRRTTETNLPRCTLHSPPFLSFPFLIFCMHAKIENFQPFPMVLLLISPSAPYNISHHHHHHLPTSQ